MTKKDEPIIERGDTSPFRCQIINLADVRIASGVPKVRNNCKHQSVVYCTEERRVWCSDCEKTVDVFDAYMILVDHLQDMLQQIKYRQTKLDDALKHTARLRAVKALDAAWGRKDMLPCCPHCDRGLMQEDFVIIVRSVSKEFELAKRRKDHENKTKNN